jgi:hypothetical protein
MTKKHHLTNVKDTNDYDNDISVISEEPLRDIDIKQVQWYFAFQEAKKKGDYETMGRLLRDG